MITDRGQVRDPFYRLGEFYGTSRAVAHSRIWQLYGGAVSDVGTGHVAMLLDHAQNGIQREENASDRFFERLIASFSVNGLYTAYKYCNSSKNSSSSE
ncbi:hypothetical protein NPIL_293431 [Nephila pilipes]|uniref:Uncharacterized protein n=1 Tax=Nephila pilipes TaxID=299642 RepID=A0A8X6N5E5_NEPPI|nr:hypothetical protein NPIL_293431 [Nephila pilipes]